MSKLKPVWQEVMGSPIEEKMLIALCDVAGWRVHRRTDCNLSYLRVFALKRLQNRELVIAPQCWVAKYRLDFAVCAKSRRGNLSIIGIECDGFAWHSTPQQKARDAIRDAVIAAHGVDVKRFTGREIHRDAETCAKLALGDLFDFQQYVPHYDLTEAEDNGELIGRAILQAEGIAA